MLQWVIGKKLMTDDIEIKTTKSGKRIFSVDVGNMPEEEARKIIEEMVLKHFNDKDKSNGN